MPVCNGAAFLAPAIESVLSQTWRDFELLVVDDGSTDGSAALASRYASADPRLRLLSMPHRGLVAALNLGLMEATGEYIARADADDVNLPQRLARQVAALDADDRVGVCGSRLAVLGSGYAWTHWNEGIGLRCTLLFGIPVFHPTVMLRRRLVASGFHYDADFEHAEDYDLWERLGEVTEFHNVPEVLVHYRQHHGQVSVQHGEAQIAASRRVRQRAIARLGLHPSPEQLQLHEQLSAVTSVDRDLLPAAIEWFEVLAAANHRTGRFPTDLFSAVLADRFALLCARLPAGALRCCCAMARVSLHSRQPRQWMQPLRLLAHKYPRLGQGLRPRGRP